MDTGARCASGSVSLDAMLCERGLTARQRWSEFRDAAGYHYAYVATAVEARGRSLDSTAHGCEDRYRVRTLRVRLRWCDGGTLKVRYRAETPTRFRLGWQFWGRY